MSAQHTPWPWTATRSNPADGADVWWITACPAPNMETEIASIQGGYPHSMREANARLIAAAPDLLAALEYIADRILAQHALNEFEAEGLSRAREAIAKAKGSAA